MSNVEQPKAKSDTGDPAVPPAGNEPPGQHTNSGNTTGTGGNEHRPREPHEKRIREWLIVLFTGTIVVGTLYYASIAKRQADLMSQQRDVMIQQVNASQRQIEESKKQTNTFDRTLTETQKSANAALRSADAGQVAASAAQTSALATVEGAQIAGKALYIGNRPYVGATVTVANLGDDKVPVFTISATNAGNTPARDLSAVATIDPRKIPLPPNPDESSGSLRKSQAVLVRGGTMTLIFRNRERPLNKGAMAILNAGQELLYVYGVVTYRDDISTKCHVLRFCTFYNPQFERFDSCEYYNREEDHPKCPN